MSRKKEIKIRNLKRIVIWPRVVGMIVTDLIILSFTGFLSYLAILGLINTHVLNNDSDCKKIISIVNKEWKGSDTKELHTEILAYETALDSIQNVYILDSSYELLQNYGPDTPNFKRIIINTREADRVLSRGDVYRISMNDEINVSLDEEESHGVKKVFSTVKKTLNFIDFATRSEKLKWGNETRMVEKQWVVYTTDIPEVYVCFEISYLINTFQLYFAVFLVMIFVLIFLYCLIYELVRIITYIADSTKYDMVISTDMATGGKNKDWFVERAQKLIKRKKVSYAVVQIRMEKYQNYCTSFGVKQGENLLELFNNTLEQVLNKKEIVAHIEKADFALLLNYSSPEQLNDRITHIVNNLAAARKNQHLTFVTGVAAVNSRTDDISFLISAAGLALTMDDNSDNHIVWFNDSMKEEQVWERRIEDDMENALTNQEFQVYLQPKYSTKGEKLAAAEALVRWVHPVLGFISPGKFIPIFENNGFILKLDDYMLNSVAKLQAQWLSEGKTLVPISVNVSRAHFTKDDLAEHICKLVDNYKVPHKYIELELTESAFFDDKAVLLNTVKKLKSYGFAVSMDDFGAGYSSLNSLKELPLDVIKLDAEFFRGIDDVNRANLIVGDTISLAKKLGMQIVAEGIETREQVDFLANQDCDLIQGFYFAKPLPVKEFEERAYPSEA